MLKLLTLTLLFVVTSYGKNPENHYLNGITFYPRERENDVADSDFGVGYDYYDYLFNNIPAYSKNAGSMDEMRIWIAKRNGAHRILHDCSCPNKTTIIQQDFGFPRYLKNVGCEDSHIHSKNCIRGSKCSEVKYNATVLVKKSREDYSEKPDIMVPSKLRKGWKLKLIPISVECHCMVEL